MVAQTSNESRPPMSSEAARVFAETAFYTALGMQREMGQRDFAITAEAREYWLDRHEVTIVRKLEEGGDWERDRPTVTQRALDLGRRAAQYAIKDFGNGQVSSERKIVEVRREHVERATSEIIRRMGQVTSSYCLRGPRK
jgi:hypothetical protein